LGEDLLQAFFHFGEITQSALSGVWIGGICDGLKIVEHRGSVEVFVDLIVDPGE
jgi:hypothetical protein